MNLKFFMNERYAFLELMLQNAVNVKDESCVALSQQELADMFHVSKQKVNRILNELISEGYVRRYKKGKYTLSSDAKAVIKVFSSEVKCISLKELMELS